MNHIGETYRRVGPLIRAMPWLVALPITAEFLQHIVEVQIGLYRFGGFVTQANAPARLALGAVKVLAILSVLLIAPRYWRFGTARAAARLDGGFFKGLAMILAVQLILLALLLGLAKLLMGIVGHDGRYLVATLFLLLSLSVAVLLAPWIVSLVTGDRAIGLRGSIGRMAPQLPRGLVLLIAAYLPGLVLHYLLGYGARQQPTALLWTMLTVDAVLVGLLAALLASAYYQLYRMAGGGPAQP